MEAVGQKKLGIGLVKWMGEDKDVYGRRGGEVGWEIFSRYAAANMKIIRSLQLSSLFLIWPLALAHSLILASLSHACPSKAGTSASATEDPPPPQHMG